MIVRIVQSSAQVKAWGTLVGRITDLDALWDFFEPIVKKSALQCLPKIVSKSFSVRPESQVAGMKTILAVGTV